MFDANQVANDCDLQPADRTLAKLLRQGTLRLVDQRIGCNQHWYLEVDAISAQRIALGRRLPRGSISPTLDLFSDVPTAELRSRGGIGP
jgi:hypothetical protein